MAILDREDLLEGQAELVSLSCLEILIFEKLLELGGLFGRELSRVLEPQPATLFQIGLWERASLLRTASTASLMSFMRWMEAIKGDLGVGQVFCGPFLEGWREVHAYLRNGLGVTAMGLQIFGELLEGFGILAWGGEEQTLGLQVHEQRDIVVATPAAGFIDTDGMDR